MITKLTTKQAWLTIAESFERKAKGGGWTTISSSGICFAIHVLEKRRCITRKQSVSMSRRLRKNKPLRACRPDWYSLWWWTRDSKGNRDRANFIRTKILKQKGKK